MPRYIPIEERQALKQVDAFLELNPEMKPHRKELIARALENQEQVRIALQERLLAPTDVPRVTKLAVGIHEAVTH